jgi:hypothetical protein
VSADSIVPSAGKPQALNRYACTFNNPLKYTDPTGHCPPHDDECEELQWQTQQQYGIQMWGDWNKSDISALQDALGVIASKMGGVGIFIYVWKDTNFIRYHDTDIKTIQNICKTTAIACATQNTIHLFDNLFNDNAWFFKYTVAHELAHVWNYKTRDLNPLTGQFESHGLDRVMARSTNSFSASCDSPQCILGPMGSVPTRSYAATNPNEDFARTFELWITEPQSKWLRDATYHFAQWRARKEFIEWLVLKVSAQYP